MNLVKVGNKIINLDQVLYATWHEKETHLTVCSDSDSLPLEGDEARAVWQHLCLAAADLSTKEG